MATSLKQEAQGYFDAAELYQASIDRLEAVVAAQGLSRASWELLKRINKLKLHQLELRRHGIEIQNYYEYKRSTEKTCHTCRHSAFSKGAYRCITLNRTVSEDGTCERWKETTQ